MNNYKGLFYNEDHQKHYYEGGAHFKYKHLVRALKELKAKREEEEENEIKINLRNKSLDIYQQDKNTKYNNLATIDNNNNYNNIFESPIHKRDKKDAYIEQLLSIDKLKLQKRHKIKLKEIKTEHRPKELEVLYTENNRYNNDNEPQIRNISMDLHKLRERNNDDFKSRILLSEDKKIKNILNAKLSTKNLEKLPKIKSLYYNNLSKKNVVENYSNSNMATNSTNIKGEFSDQINTKLEFEINKSLKKPDFLIFSNKKNLPQISGNSLSIFNNNKSNNTFEKNKLMFTINNNRNNKEDLTINRNNKNKSLVFSDNNNDEDDKDIIIRNINLTKNNYKVFKLKNKDNEISNIEIKSKLMDNSKRKKSHKKSSRKKKKKKENESDE